jgi:hypothetical protein
MKSWERLSPLSGSGQMTMTDPSHSSPPLTGNSPILIGKRFLNEIVFPSLTLRLGALGELKRPLHWVQAEPGREMFLVHFWPKN